MSFSGLRINLFDNKNHKLGSNFQKNGTFIRKNHRGYCRENFNEYLFNSTLHGLKYVGDRTISRMERLFFAVMFFLVVLASIYFISNVWIKWRQSPLIVTINSESTSVKAIPFPATTICNMNQIRKSAVENIAKDSVEYDVVLALCGSYVGNVSARSADVWTTFRPMRKCAQFCNAFCMKMYTLCAQNVYIFIQNALQDFPQFLIGRETLLKVTPSCEDMLLYCEYGGQEFNCTSSFSTILTDDGFCCVFNAVDRKYLMKTVPKNLEELDDNDISNYRAKMWTPERGYASQKFKNNTEKFPRPGVGSGNEVGLSLILNAHVDDYFCPSTKSFGFKVLLHNPNDISKIYHYGMSVPTGYESRIAVTPSFNIATQATRKMPIDVRQCIFENENFLSFYSTYSERNCQNECVTKLLYRYCNCIMFYQPLFRANLSICGAADEGCISDFLHEMKSDNPLFKCDQCIGACFALNFESTLSMAKIYNQVPFLRKRQLDPNNIAIIHTYYSRSTFRAHKKDELVGLTDFLSGIGGLFGLFMGFSVISVIEMFYFVSIRPYCNYLCKRRDLMMGIVRRLGTLRERNNALFTIKAVQPNSNIDHKYQRTYLD